MGQLGDLSDALTRRLAAAERPDDHGIRLADEADFAALDRLNEEVVADCGGEVVFGRMTVAFFERIHRAKGNVVLVTDGGAIRGYSVVVPTGPGMPAFSPGGGRIGLIFGTAASRAIRGRGWHRLLISMRVDALAEIGCTSVQAVVSPLNHGSLGNLLRSGFQAIAFTTAVHDAPRFVVEHGTADAGRAADQDDALPLPPDGPIEPHIERLAAGWRGVSLSRSPALMSYAPPRETCRG